MESVDVINLLPGHVVASAVLNPGGAVLCPAGFTLTAEAIQHLRRAGVASVMVDLDPDRAQALNARIAALNDRFSGTGDPVLLQLRAAMERRLQLLKL